MNEPLETLEAVCARFPSSTPTPGPGPWDLFSGRQTGAVFAAIAGGLQRAAAQEAKTRKVGDEIRADWAVGPDVAVGIFGYAFDLDVVGFFVVVDDDGAVQWTQWALADGQRWGLIDGTGDIRQRTPETTTVHPDMIRLSAGDYFTAQAEAPDVVTGVVETGFSLAELERNR